MNRAWVLWLPRPLQNLLHGRTNLQGVISNSSWMFFDSAFRMIVSLLLGTLIARHLGPEGYGTLHYAVAFVSIFSILVTLGLDGVVVRELSLRPQDKPVILGTTLAIKLCGGVIAFALAMVVIATSNTTTEMTIILVAILGPGLIFQAFETVTFWFQSQLQAHWVVVARGIVFIGVSALRIWLLVTQSDLGAFAWAGLIEVSLTGIALILAYRIAGNPLSIFRFDPLLARSLLRQSWPLAVSGMFVLLTMQMDKVLIGELADTAQVGIYSVANQLSAIWYSVPIIIGISVAPTLFRTQAAGDPNYLKSLGHIYKLLTHISVPTALVVSFLATPIITLLFGADYEGAGRVLAIHIWGGVFVFHISIRSRALLAEGKQKFVTAMAALTFLTNILLNIMLIGPYGAEGAAWASLISWALCATVFPAFWSQTRASLSLFFSSFKVSY